MARAKVYDFLHNFRFHVIVYGYGTSHDPKIGSLDTDKVSAGFSSCSVPEVSEDAQEYREGHFIYTKKYVGLPTVSDVSLARGVSLVESATPTVALWQWVKDTVEANNEYRADVDILHIHRNMKPETRSAGSGPVDEMSIKTDIGLRIYHCYNAFPIRYKASSDLDATSGEVSIQELDLAVENFDIEVKGTPVTAGLASRLAL